MRTSNRKKGSIDRDAANTRVKILDAARQEFIERGYDGARVQRIAELSGVNKAMIYYYFGSKIKLYRLVFRKVVLGNLQKLEKITYGDEPVEEKIGQLVNFYLQIFGGDPGFVRLVMRELAGESVVLKELFAEVRSQSGGIDFPGAIFEMIFQKGIKESLFRPIDPRHTLVSLVGMSAGYFFLRPVADSILGMDGKPSEEFAAERSEQIADLLLKGILRRNKEDGK